MSGGIGAHGASGSCGTYGGLQTTRSNGPNSAARAHDPRWTSTSTPALEAFIRAHRTDREHTSNAVTCDAPCSPAAIPTTPVPVHKSATRRPRANPVFSITSMRNWLSSCGAYTPADAINPSARRCKRLSHMCLSTEVFAASSQQCRGLMPRIRRVKPPRPVLRHADLGTPLAVQISDRHSVASQGRCRRTRASPVSSRGRGRGGDLGADGAGQRRTADAVLRRHRPGVQRDRCSRWPARHRGVGVPYPAAPGSAVVRSLGCAVGIDRRAQPLHPRAGHLLVRRHVLQPDAVALPRPRVVVAGTTRHRDRHSRPRPRHHREPKSIRMESNSTSSRQRFREEFRPLARLTLRHVDPSCDDIAFDPALHADCDVQLLPRWLADFRRAAYRRSRARTRRAVAVRRWVHRRYRRRPARSPASPCRLRRPHRSAQDGRPSSTRRSDSSS